MIFIQYGQIDVKDGAFVVIDENGVRTHIPVGSVACVMLEPGTRVSHAAAKLAAPGETGLGAFPAHAGMNRLPFPSFLIGISAPLNRGDGAIRARYVGRCHGYPLLDLFEITVQAADVLIDDDAPGAYNSSKITSSQSLAL